MPTWSLPIGGGGSIYPFFGGYHQQFAPPHTPGPPPGSPATFHHHHISIPAPDLAMVRAKAAATNMRWEISSLNMALWNIYNV